MLQVETLSFNSTPKVCMAAAHILTTTILATRNITHMKDHRWWWKLCYCYHNAALEMTRSTHYWQNRHTDGKEDRVKSTGNIANLPAIQTGLNTKNLPDVRELTTDTIQVSK